MMVGKGNRESAMSGERPHQKLDVWIVSMELCREVYSLCRTLPDDERYGLSSQMRRAVVSVPSNVAEGAARGTRREFTQFLNIAQGSLAELETQLELCGSYLKLLDSTTVVSVLEKASRVARMITGLKKALRADASERAARKPLTDDSRPSDD